MPCWHAFSMSTSRKLNGRVKIGQWCTRYEHVQYHKYCFKTSLPGTCLRVVIFLHDPEKESCQNARSTSMQYSRLFKVVIQKEKSRKKIIKNCNPNFFTCLRGRFWKKCTRAYSYLYHKYMLYFILHTSCVLDTLNHKVQKYINNK